MAKNTQEIVSQNVNTLNYNIALIIYHDYRYHNFNFHAISSPSFLILENHTTITGHSRSVTYSHNPGWDFIALKIS